ncbi:hypothetical protein [Methylocystis heyeri]|uniref:DUF4402 domain-containing protein n=1 Tax=Methylocystis heyeri TaxID=391905 RepID=A0A6B8KLD1_9HYPH|nr:hypothetical protein [Methylocystis heyeri]QGM47453.1 hypothetical protein H2LOC_018140 [Methylocystis heyeri]
MTTRNIFTLLFCAAMLFSVDALAIDAQTPGAIPLESVPVRLKPATTTTQYNGTVAISAVIAANAQTPDGTTINYNASAVVMDGFFTSERFVGGSATFSGGAATISVNIPYAFFIGSSSATLNISFGVSSTVNPPNSGPITYSLAFGSSPPLPASGATTPVSFSGTF